MMDAGCGNESKGLLGHCCYGDHPLTSEHDDETGDKHCCSSPCRCVGSEKAIHAALSVFASLSPSSVRPAQRSVRQEDFMEKTFLTDDGELRSHSLAAALGEDRDLHFVEVCTCRQPEGHEMQTGVRLPIEEKARYDDNAEAETDVELGGSPQSTETSDVATAAPEIPRWMLQKLALTFSFVAIVSCWGVIDVGIEAMAPVGDVRQTWFYGAMLGISAFLTLAVHISKLPANAFVIVLSAGLSFFLAVGGWGFVNSIVFFAAGASEAMKIFYFTCFFSVAVVFIVTYIWFVDPAFSVDLIGCLL
ncbi:hypothetical protein BESB_006210 [Besnoitia besnoiti]|uniref:Transmembrane protein n=1 Tax=Besnoitia besnoiti TaxID=94643 RepID=A0A2A9MQG4_BESBE|nr:hypothetical protein BESB_006210 [Besnoitia besnoiti]PFH38280.1 hypothetical protein BESB_006210 [Besnoitia besnoiti]